jgi:hypothetical protein
VCFFLEATPQVFACANIPTPCAWQASLLIFGLECELIRLFMPPLNTQIPNKKNWRKFTCREIDEE